MENKTLNLLAFNELSLSDASQIHIADFFYNWIKIKEIFLLKSFPKILFTFSQLENTNKIGVKLRDMIENSGLNEHNKSILYNEINSSPFIIDEQIGVVSYLGKESSGLTFSHYHKIPTISLLSEVDWQSFILKSNHEYLDDIGEILNVDVNIKNIANLEGMKDTWIEEFKPDWLSSIEIFKATLSSFDKVVVSDNVIEYLKLNKVESLWSRFYNIVSSFNSYSHDFWKRENVMWSKLNEKFNLNVRPESDITLSKYGSQRNFNNENGCKEIFSYHFDMSKSLRGYVKEMPLSKSFYIAEITHHLDIAT